MTGDFFEGDWFIRFYLGFFLIVLAFGGVFFAWAYRSGHLRDNDRVRSMPLLIELPGDPPHGFDDPRVVPERKDAEIAAPRPETRPSDGPVSSADAADSAGYAGYAGYAEYGGHD